MLSRFSRSARRPSSLCRARMERSFASVGSYSSALSRNPSTRNALSELVSFSV